MSLSNGSISATWTFDHYADGKIQKVTDSQNPIFDRAFDYDHIGRLQEVRTGSEARGGSTPDGPFKQTYTYDVWENTTARSYRIWSGSMQNESATFTNNKRQYWFYDNEGNLSADFDASYGYDAAGRQNHFHSHATVGGWPTQHPQQPAMEISQTFDGNSTPVKKTTITRSELFVGEEVQIQEDTTHVYYLRSSVLGKVIAELDQTGYKRLGYVFAGGMQIATQSVWNPDTATTWR